MTPFDRERYVKRLGPPGKHSRGPPVVPVDDVSASLLNESRKVEGPASYGMMYSSRALSIQIPITYLLCPLTLSLAFLLEDCLRSRRTLAFLRRGS